MIDYLYRLDYDDSPKSQNTSLPVDETENQPADTVPEPDSPVRQMINKLEGRAENPFSGTDWPGSWGKPRDKKSNGHEKTSPSPVSDEVVDGLPVQEDTRMSTHAKMYALADKFGIPDLKDLASAKFVEATVSGVVSRQFPAAVQTVYTSTPKADRGLRDVIVQRITDNREFLDRNEIENLARTVEDLAIDLMKAFW